MLKQTAISYPLDLIEIIRHRLPEQSLVADCGCFRWKLAGICHDSGHRIIGLDRSEPPGRPPWADFSILEGAHAQLADDSINLVVANHILEHIIEPIKFFSELARITMPGGLIWIEAPSELSALPKSSDDPTDNRFYNFWDDPTHVRPWTLAGLYRLALSCRCMPLVGGRAVNGDIHVVQMLIQKPTDIQGRPPTKYISLEDVEPGFESAWSTIWGHTTP